MKRIFFVWICDWIILEGWFIQKHELKDVLVSSCYECIYFYSMKILDKARVVLFSQSNH